MSFFMLDSSVVKEALSNEGAAVVGICLADELPEVEEFLSEQDLGGKFAGMAWLGRSAHKRTHPKDHLEGAKSVICTAWPYSSEKNKYFSRYSLHIDYHDFILERLKRAWKSVGCSEDQARFFVDSKPLAEKAYASLAGIGWIGKNSLVINPKIGSFFCMGFILTDFDLEIDQPIKNECGDCSKCIDACPTKAIVSPGVIDSNRCISYLTTEHKGDIPEDLKPLIGCNVFGCDICQEVCHFNKDVKIKSSIPQKEITISSLKQLTSLSESDFKKTFEGTPIIRLGRDRLLRNVEAICHSCESRNPD